jgi:4-hydroxybenzoate polyprenyltransferase
MVGILSGSLVAYGATRHPWPWFEITLAAIAAGVLNAASNVLNQICDLAADRVNKAHRPLPAGVITVRAASWYSAALYAISLVLAATVNRQTFVIYCIAAVATYAYSAPPFRLKATFWGANLTIAAIRGELLKVAGWAAVSSVLNTWEPWLIGFVFFVFLLGATSTKDFADMEGDRIQDCRTWPVVLGPERAARAIVPFFLAPWLIVAIGAAMGWLTGNHAFLLVLAAVMLAWGAWVSRLLVADPARLVSEGENHPAWRQMYLMMMASHLGIAAGYLVPR